MYSYDSCIIFPIFCEQHTQMKAMIIFNEINHHDQITESVSQTRKPYQSKWIIQTTFVDKDLHKTIICLIGYHHFSCIAKKKKNL